MTGIKEEIIAVQARFNSSLPEEDEDMDSEIHPTLKRNLSSNNNTPRRATNKRRSLANELTDAILASPALNTGTVHSLSTPRIPPIPEYEDEL